MPRFGISFDKHKVKNWFTHNGYEKESSYDLADVESKLPAVEFVADSPEDANTLLETLKKYDVRFTFQAADPRDAGGRQTDFYIEAQTGVLTLMTRCPHCDDIDWVTDFTPRTMKCFGCGKMFTVCVTKEQCNQCLQRPECMLWNDR